jgi:hypothetical protein
MHNAMHGVNVITAKQMRVRISGRGALQERAQLSVLKRAPPRRARREVSTSARPCKQASPSARCGWFAAAMHSSARGFKLPWYGDLATRRVPGLRCDCARMLAMRIHPRKDGWLATTAPSASSPCTYAHERQIQGTGRVTGHDRVSAMLGLHPALLRAAGCCHAKAAAGTGGANKVCLASYAVDSLSLLPAWVRVPHESLTVLSF